MKSTSFFSLISTCVLLLIISCKKEYTNQGNGTATLTIVNGLVSTGGLYARFDSDKPNTVSYSQTKVISYGIAYLFNSYSGQPKLGFYTRTDTTSNSRPILEPVIDLPVNTIHSLFLAGTPQDADYLFTTDELPDHAPQDSTLGIRFVNMTKGSSPISVNIAGQNPGSEASNLAYKTVSGFKKYQAGSKVTSYRFEFRDQTTGTLLGNCLIDGVNNNGSAATPNLRRYRNFTLVLLAASGGQATARVIIVSDKLTP